MESCGAKTCASTVTARKQTTIAAPIPTWSWVGTVYASSMKRDITPAERLARLADRHGYNAFKFRVGRLLQDHGVSHFEEPCPYWEIEQTREVAEALDIDVAGGEQDCMIPTWRRIIEMRAVDIIQPDVCYAGGLSRTLQIAGMGAGAGLPCTPHSANLSMVTMFTMHLLGAIPNPGKYLEFSIEGPDYYPWQEGLFRNRPYEVTDGAVTIPSEPGWGVEIEPAWLDHASYRVSAP